MVKRSSPLVSLYIDTQGNVNAVKQDEPIIPMRIALLKHPRDLCQLTGYIYARLKWKRSIVFVKSEMWICLSVAKRGRWLYLLPRDPVHITRNTHQCLDLTIVDNVHLMCPPTHPILCVYNIHNTLFINIQASTTYFYHIVSQLF
jgi:hypothetical protein